MKKQAKPAAKKAAPVRKTAPKKDADQALLDRYQRHRDKAEHHRAQADLIEARLKTKGKEIRHQYPGESAPVQRQAPKPVIAPRRNYY